MKSESGFWKGNCQKKATEIADQLDGIDHLDFVRAVERECRSRHARFAEGVRRYQTLQRPERPPGFTIPWRAGTTTMRDYGADADGAPVILIVPSLVNRADVLDLGCGRSFIEDLRAEGLHPLLIDWDAPGEAELKFDLSRYIVDRLEPALDAAIAINQGAPIILAGYCMGGDLALALALRQQHRIAGLALLATPWNFHAGDMAQIEMLKASMPILGQTLETLGGMPVDLLQAMFTGLDPWLTPAKFMRFADFEADAFEAQLFVALEDWLNDGVPLAPAVARECLEGWYVNNTPGTGTWHIDGSRVDPTKFTPPSIAFIPGRDHIVPPSSARALADALPNCVENTVPAGHIGMVTGSRAHDILTAPLASWVKSLSY